MQIKRDYKDRYIIRLSSKDWLNLGKIAGWIKKADTVDSNLFIDFMDSLGEEDKILIKDIIDKINKYIIRYCKLSLKEFRLENGVRYNKEEVELKKNNFYMEIRNLCDREILNFIVNRDKSRDKRYSYNLNRSFKVYLYHIFDLNKINDALQLGEDKFLRKEIRYLLDVEDDDTFTEEISRDDLDDSKEEEIDSEEWNGDYGDNFEAGFEEGISRDNNEKIWFSDSVKRETVNPPYSLLREIILLVKEKYPKLSWKNEVINEINDLKEIPVEIREELIYYFRSNIDELLPELTNGFIMPYPKLKELKPVKPVVNKPAKPPVVTDPVIPESDATDSVSDKDIGDMFGF